MRNLLKGVIVVALVFVLSACNWLEFGVGNLKEELVGREMLVQTYDEDSQLIDRIQGKSISVNADGEFAIKDSEGKTVE